MFMTLMIVVASVAVVVALMNLRLSRRNCLKKISNHADDDEKAEQFLNTMGRNRWELVCIRESKHRRVQLMYFKRPCNNQEEQ